MLFNVVCPVTEILLTFIIELTNNVLSTNEERLILPTVRDNCEDSVEYTLSIIVLFVIVRLLTVVKFVLVMYAVFDTVIKLLFRTLAYVFVRFIYDESVE